MEITGKANALNKILCLGIQPTKCVLLRIETGVDIKFVVYSITKYSSIIESLISKSSVHVIMWSGSNLFIDIDTKSPEEYKIAILACNRLTVQIKTNNPIAEPVLFGNGIGLHYHCRGMWFNDVVSMKKYLKSFKYISKYIDDAVYKSNTSLRISQSVKYKNSTVVDNSQYKIVNIYGGTYTPKDIMMIQTMTIPSSRTTTTNIVPYIYGKNESMTGSRIPTESIDDIKEYIEDMYGLKISNISLSNRGVYNITPQKPYHCPICDRQHDSNNLYTSDNKLHCYMTRM